jgi:hypothetical protein
MSQVRFSEVSQPRQALIRLCQAINYGHIEGLYVRGREPMFTPAPLLLVDVKLDQDESVRLEVELTDFEVAGEIRRLLLQLNEIEDGKIERIEVRGGLPRRVMFSLRLPDSLP